MPSLNSADETWPMEVLIPHSTPICNKFSCRDALSLRRTVKMFCKLTASIFGAIVFFFALDGPHLASCSLSHLFNIQCPTSEVCPEADSPRAPPRLHSHSWAHPDRAHRQHWPHAALCTRGRPWARTAGLPGSGPSAAGAPQLRAGVGRASTVQRFPQ